jgi:hypothetical protein
LLSQASLYVLPAERVFQVLLDKIALAEKIMTDVKGVGRCIDESGFR